MNRAARFRYSLEAVLKVRQQSRDLALSEEMNARRVVMEKEERASEIGRQVGDLEHALRDLSREGAYFDPRKQALVSRYLSAVREQLESTLVELSQARRVHQQVVESLNAHSQSVKALERHRTTRADQHARAFSAAAQKEQEDLWLAGNATR